MASHRPTVGLTVSVNKGPTFRPRDSAYYDNLDQGYLTVSGILACLGNFLIYSVGNSVVTVDLTVWYQPVVVNHCC